MPAGREQHGRVVREGTSDADGQAPVVALLEVGRKRSRISSAVMRPDDRPTADDGVPAQQHRRLPGSRSGDRLGEDERVAVDRAGHGSRAVAQLDGVDLVRRAPQHDVADSNPVGLQRLPRADRHGVALRVRREDVDGLAARHADAAALPHGEVVVAGDGCRAPCRRHRRPDPANR
jgi:hypothetical protein